MSFKAVTYGKHFTQSAGLVAVHPVAHALCSEYSEVAWLLRNIAYLKFGYDPDGVLSRGRINSYGFVGDTMPEVPFTVASIE